ncbi:hypothetical protein [Rhizobium sp. NLR22b]|uniref:hypothetical protein n=1 Tax=Rhizobium sp. NLR22b TaxID=2731115 RepID=UPI001C832CA8|nr:hypothetical protein [Rhizobium sp. NLR22b]MBX5242025.1 hypothetical protein [Rhizobium sp. NLR22b]
MGKLERLVERALAKAGSVIERVVPDDPDKAERLGEKIKGVIGEKAFDKVERFADAADLALENWRIQKEQDSARRALMLGIRNDRSGGRDVPLQGIRRAAARTVTVHLEQVSDQISQPRIPDDPRRDRRTRAEVDDSPWGRNELTFEQFIGHQDDQRRSMHEGEPRRHAAESQASNLEYYARHGPPPPYSRDYQDAAPPAYSSGPQRPPHSPVEVGAREVTPQITAVGPRDAAARRGLYERSRDARSR